MDYLPEIKYWLNAILSPISIILNLVLIYLIKYHSSKNLESYKKVLYLGWLTDFVFAFWNILVDPDMKVIDGIYFVLSSGFLGPLPGALTAWCFLGSAFLMYFSVVNVAIQFIYRYLLLCWKITLNILAFLCLVFIGVVPICAYLYYFVHHLITRTRSDETYAHLLNDSDWVKDGKLLTFGTFRVEAIINAVYIAFSLTTISCIMVFLCGIEIFRNILTNTEKLSKSNRSYQKQITIVMTIEAIVPLITIAFPILLDVTAIMFGMYIPIAGKLGFLLGGFAPVINPIVKMTVVTCYRKKLLELLHIRRLFNSTTTVHTFASSSN